AVAAASELLTDKSVGLLSRLDSPLFGQRLAASAVNATALARREGARPVLPVVLAMAGRPPPRTWGCAGGRSLTSVGAPPRARWWRTSPPSAWLLRRPGARARGGWACPRRSRRGRARSDPLAGARAPGSPAWSWAPTCCSRPLH